MPLPAGQWDMPQGRIVMPHTGTPPVQKGASGPQRRGRRARDRGQGAYGAGWPPSSFALWTSNLQAAALEIEMEPSSWEEVETEGRVWAREAAHHNRCQTAPTATQADAAVRWRGACTVRT